MRDRADIRAVMPPVIDRSVRELLLGMKKDLLSRKFRPRRKKDLAVLQLIAEPVTAA